MDTTGPTVRACFASAASGFAELVAAVPAGCWEHPGLGVWNVRELVGHTSRALSTIEAYLGNGGPGPLIDGPAAYFLAVGHDHPGSEARRVRDEAIAERGRDAALALGEDPARTVADLADQVVALVAGSLDDAVMATAVGSMTLAGYLPTRTFELAVHSLDLARAVNLEPPEKLAPAITESLALASQLAAARPEAAEVLVALCGRAPLPGRFSVL